MTEDQVKIVEGLKEAMRSVNGRALLFALLEDSGLLKSSAQMTGAASDPYATYFLEGKRAMGLLLMDSLNKLSPDAYARLLALRAADLKDKANKDEANPAEE